MTSSKSIAVVSMSTRTPRVGPHVAAFVKKTLDADAAASGLDLPLVDLADFKLPVYDESVVPFMVPDQATFSHAHSLAWSSEIKRHAGYVLVLPEYNFTLAGSTKNAIDYLAHEWRGKPVVIVTYGVVGGTYASEHAVHIFTNLKLRVAETKPQLAFAGNRGPDMFAAVLEGKLGEETVKLWGVEKSESLLKAFDELKELLKEDGEAKS
ncbi:flavoprotein-like protein [Bombardia bombarda]|uniref:Flavoprotein-like protein n=1 Tax=Bombardia bombarda TaxID=252184 RepID=A0AA40C563_9PEZI|nr:flavoprotein-like protein [Bombardia bombarda]